MNTLWLAVPKNWELSPGCGRSIDPVFAEEIQDRRLHWSVSDTRIAAVDAWGRVTAMAEGSVEITASCVADPSVTATCQLTVRKSPTALPQIHRKEYDGVSSMESSVSQKMVDRWSWEEAEAAIPRKILDSLRPGGDLFQKVVTPDGAIWNITEYGVRRDDQSEALERDRSMRLMGNRYFYDVDSPVLGICSDGESGIWAATEHGVTHIHVKQIGAEEKADILNEITQRHVCRRGAVTEAAYRNGKWVPLENDNDGLWTAMYAAGELFHYAVLRDEGADPEKLRTVRKAAVQSSEEMLLLANIPCRTGTTEAKIHYQTVYSGSRGFGKSALKKDGNGSLPIPQKSPAHRETIGEKNPFYPADWIETQNDGELESRTRWLAGFPARNYLLRGLEPECPEDYKFDEGIYYCIQPGGKAVSKTGKEREQTLINGDYNQDLCVDAGEELPPRLMHLISDTINPKTGKPFGKEDVIYKGDASLDEIIGHLFFYKIAYDVLGPEDPKIKEILVSTIRNLAQHFSDNNYMLIDASGQPCTWGKASREYFYSPSGSINATLAGAVLLCVFKTAAYMTGEEKWENEYRLAAGEEPYQYADIMTQYWDRDAECIQNYIDSAPELVSEKIKEDETFQELVQLNNLNYSDEEMAMLCFYLLFQMETEEELLSKYRLALDSWWRSMQYSENPLWYFMYQLFHPEEVQTDAYGNRMVDTAAWSLGRHPMDLRRWCATSSRRDDVESISLAGQLGWGSESRYELCYKKLDEPFPEEAFQNPQDPRYAEAILAHLRKIKENLTIAAPDERSLHKFNRTSFILWGKENSEYYNPMMMEGSTTYTLPYWFGRYHHLLRKKEEV